MNRSLLSPEHVLPDNAAIEISLFVEYMSLVLVFTVTFELSQGKKRVHWVGWRGRRMLRNFDI